MLGLAKPLGFRVIRDHRKLRIRIHPKPLDHGVRHTSNSLCGNPVVAKVLGDVRVVSDQSGLNTHR